MTDELNDIDPQNLTEGEQEALDDIANFDAPPAGIILDITTEERGEDGVEDDVELALEDQATDPEPLKSEMPDWVQRMRDEAEDLEGKIQRLSKMLSNPLLTAEAYALLIEQREFMKGYLFTLNKRIEASY